MELETSMDKDCENWILEHLPNYIELFREHDFTSLEALATVQDTKRFNIFHIRFAKQNS